MNSRQKKIAADIEKLRVENEKVVRSWSSINRIVRGVDDLASKIKTETGLHCDRSKLINLLAEHLIEVQDKIDMTHITDRSTLKEALLNALKKRR